MSKTLELGASLVLGVWGLVLFLGSSHSAKESSEDAADAAARLPIGLHSLRIFDQANRRRELRIFKRRSQPGHRLRVRDARRHFKDISGQMIDSIEQAAATADENSFADVVDK
jgi:hypothetical protein